ncbi:MAG TPA: N-acetyltransferase [Jiangellaceae bacterium]|nr:N-acetyltransferase [Jiangellaceae bacterium]
MDLRLEQLWDQPAVHDLHRAAFGEDDKVADLVDNLRATVTADDGLSLVATEAGDVVGHVMFTHSWLDAPRQLVDVQVLSPLAVLPERHRQGIGSALARRGLQVMSERSVPVVFVEGDPAYYSRFGFMAGAPQGFRKPSLRIPDAAFQAIRLAAHEPWMSGTLVYSEIFWQHDVVGLRDADDRGDLSSP